MWFDASREVPLLGSLTSDSEGTDGFYEGGALDGTLREEECVPLVGGDSGMQLDLCDQASEESPQDAPEGFLDSLWEGGWDG